MLNFLTKVWGIAEQRDPQVANSAIDDAGIRNGQANAAVATARRNSTQTSGSNPESLARRASYLLPEELRKRPSSSGAPSRRSSTYGPQQATFKRVEGVDYEKLDAVLANHEAMEQLVKVSEGLLCSENLGFLMALKALRADPSAVSRWDKFGNIIAKWVSDSARTEISIDSATRNRLCEVFRAGPKPAGADGGIENYEPLLLEAETAVRRLLQVGPLKILRDGLAS